MLAWQWQDKTINMVILSNTYSVVKTLLEAQVSVYSLRVSPFFLLFHGAGWEQTLREKLYTLVSVFLRAFLLSFCVGGTRETGRLRSGENFQKH